MFCRVECYIEYGWDQYLTDPDGGVNCLQKLTSVHSPGSESQRLLQCLPPRDDMQWTKQLYCIPTVTFSSIYDFLVSRKVSLKKVRHIENAVDNREENGLSGEDASDQSWYESAEYTRTLDKAYRFFKDGHVQNLKYHPWTNQTDVICVTATVLPSMRKDRVYFATIIMRESNARVVTAYCTCPAGLSGCCNHTTATLYCLEDYVHLGLREVERLGCTERLQKWNQPKKRNIEPRPTDDVWPHKTVYGKEKRSKFQHVNNWDCRPSIRRMIDPNKARLLRESLCIIEKNKIDAADFFICTATTDRERKQALEKKSMLTSYGTSCFVQILDDELAPLENRKEEMRKERIARAEMQKEQLMQHLAALQSSVLHDHDYTCKTDDPLPNQQEEIESNVHNESNIQQKLINDLYTHHVHISATGIHELETLTRGQSESEKWHSERKLRITASVMREVCHHRPTTSCTAFTKRKLSCNSINTPAICYGKKHEKVAIGSYVKHQNMNGKVANVEPCGLFVDHSTPWLAASPDAIVTDFSEPIHKRGCVEVKCPYACETRTIEDACKMVKGFCLRSIDGQIQLSKSHSYYYQVQTQMHVTNLQWCDFVVWSPMEEEPFVQRIKYDSTFMENNLSKARTFYFKKFLPAVVPYLIVSPTESLLACRERKGTVKEPDCLKLVHGHLDNRTDTDSHEVNLVKQRYKSGSDKLQSSDGKLDPKGSGNTQEVVVEKPLYSNVKEGQGSGQTASSTPVVSQSRAEKQELTYKENFDCDIQLVEAHTNPHSVSLKTVLEHLRLTKHQIKGDGSCLYHSVAHQAKLIPTFSIGDEVVSRHLRRLTLLTMLNYPAVQLESNLSKQAWLNKQQQVLNNNEWGGDVELRLMAIGLKRSIIVITDSNVNVFARKFPQEPPPIPKMKGGIFIPITSSDLFASENLAKDSLIIVYNGSNHYYSTLPCDIIS